MRLASQLVLQAAALAGVAALCALLSNALARPERRLSWTSAPPTVRSAPSLPFIPVPLAAPIPAPPPPPQEEPFPTLQARPAAPKALPAPKPFPLRSGQPIREISSDEAGQAFRAGVPFLDARRSAEFELGRVQGAWSLPIWEEALDTRLIEFEAKANAAPEAPLVLYCSGGSCEDSHLLASRLFQLGYRNLLIYSDGYPDWVAQGRPIAKGALR